MNGLIRFVATGAYSGLLTPWSGTWGSIPPLLLAWWIAPLGSLTLLAVAAGVVLLSVWGAGEGEKLMGHDHRSIVIDEWAGMLITVLFIPLTLATAVTAFFFFRLFDVIKLWPARQAEALPGGLGVTMDDVVAGVQANIALRLLLMMMPGMAGSAAT